MFLRKKYVFSKKKSVFYENTANMTYICNEKRVGYAFFVHSLLNMITCEIGSAVGRWLPKLGVVGLNPIYRS